MWRYFTGALDGAEEDVDLQALREQAKKHRQAAPPSSPQRRAGRAGARRAERRRMMDAMFDFDGDEEDGGPGAPALSAVPLPQLRAAPAAAVWFKTEVEAWVREQCESVGCGGVLVNLAAPPTMRDPLACPGAKKPRQVKPAADGDADRAPCPLCGSRTGGTCSVSGIPHEGLHGRMRVCSGGPVEGAVDVQVDAALCTHVAARDGAAAAALRQAGGVDGTIPGTGRLSTPCGSAQRAALEPTYGRHLYLVNSAGDATQWVPPAFLRAGRSEVLQLPREGARKRARSATPPPPPLPPPSSGCPETVDVLLHAATGGGGALVAAAEVALSKLAFFMRRAADVPREVAAAMPLLAEAVAARFPDTALFHRDLDDVWLFCACGVGAQWVPAWFDHVRVATLPGGAGANPCVSLLALRNATGCGVATTVPRAKRFPLWEVQEKKESKEHPQGITRTLTPADSHVVDGFFAAHVNALPAAAAAAPSSAAASPDVLFTPLTLSNAALYKIDARTRTLRKCASGQRGGAGLPLRQVRPAVLVEDIRKGDMVRLVAAADGGARRGDVGEVERVDGVACVVLFRGTLRWTGSAAALTRLDLRDGFRQTAADAAAHTAVVFGPPAAVAPAWAAYEAMQARRRTALLLPPATAHLFSEKIQDVVAAAGLQAAEVRSTRIVVQGTAEAVAKARVVVRALVADYAAAFQRWKLDGIKAGIRASLTKTSAAFPRHAGFVEAFAASEMLGHGTEGGVALPGGEKKEAPGHGTRPAQVVINGAGGMEIRFGAGAGARGQAEEDRANAAMILWSTLDDFSDRAKRDAARALGAAEEEWALPPAQLGVRVGGEVSLELHDTSKHRVVGDRVRLRPEALAGKYRYLGLDGGDTGCVVATQGASLSVSFPSHAAWRLDAADVEPCRRAARGVVKAVEMGLQGGADDTGGLRFARAVGKWVKHITEGGEDPGRPTTAALVVAASDNVTVLRLTCPSMGAYEVLSGWGALVGTVEGRAHHAAREAVHCKWLAIVDEYLLAEVANVATAAPATLARGVRKVNAMAKEATARCGALLATLAELKRLAQDEALAAAAVVKAADAAAADPGRVEFVDGDGDEVVLELEGGRCWYTPVGQAPPGALEKMEYTASGRMLTVTLEGGQVWKIWMPQNRALLERVAALIRYGGPGLRLEENLVEAVDAGALDVVAFVAKLDVAVSALAKDWKEALSSSLFIFQSNLAKVRRCAIDEAACPRAAAPLHFKQQVEALTGACLDPEGGVVTGTADAVAGALACVEAGAGDVGAANVVAVPVAAGVAEALTENAGAMCVCVGAAARLEDIRVEAARGRRPAVVRMVGTKGQVEKALSLLGLSGSAAVEAVGPDAAAVRAGGAADVDVPARAEDSATVRLSCGHVVDPASVQTARGGLRCPVCSALLTSPDVRTYVTWRNAQSGAEAPLRVLKVLHDQLDAAMGDAEGVRRCGACPAWVYVGRDSPCVVCSECGKDPSPVAAAGAGAPRRVVPVCPSEVCCARCGKAHLHEGAMCSSEGSSEFLCTACSAQDGGAHELEHVTFASTYDATETCALGHPVVEAFGRTCDTCRSNRVVFACGTCGTAACAACNVPSAVPTLAVMDDAFFAKLGLARPRPPPPRAARATPLRDARHEAASLQFLYAVAEAEDPSMQSRGLLMNSLRARAGPGGGGGPLDGVPMLSNLQSMFRNLGVM